MGDRAEEVKSTRLCDIGIENFLRASIVRATEGPAGISRVAEGHRPSGCSLVTAADLPGPGEIELPSCAGEGSFPLLAGELASYKGQPVALALAPDEDRLQEYAASISVELREPLERQETTIFRRSYSKGNCDLAFSIADRIVEGEYRLGPRASRPGEPRGALVSFEYDKLVVRCQTTWPALVRDCVARALSCRPSEVLVRPSLVADPDVDAYSWYPAYLAALAAIAARYTGKPVALLPTRLEDLAWGPRSPETVTRIETALDASGAITAMRVRTRLFAGFRAVFAEEAVTHAALASHGTYSIPNFEEETAAVDHGGPPTSPSRGNASAALMSAIELHVSRIASDYGLDPLDWKSATLARSGPLVAGKGETVPFEAIAERVLVSSDFYRKYSCYELIRKRRGDRFDGPLKGIGFSFARQASGPPLALPWTRFSAEATLTKDMKLELATSATPWIAETARELAFAAAKSMGMAEEDVLFAEEDSCPDSGPIFSGSAGTTLRRLVVSACEAIQKKRFRSPLPIRERATVRPRKGFSPDSPDSTPFDGFSWAGAVAELELDEGTLLPRVLGLWICADSGHVPDQARATRLLTRLAIEELSWCSSEWADWDVDPVASARALSSLDAFEIPEVRIDFIERDDRVPVKTLDCLAASTIPAAYLSALSQATGIRFRSLPVQSDDMFLQFDAL